MTQPKGAISRILLVAVLSAVLVSVLLPNTALAWMRRHWMWFNTPMHWIEHSNSVVNLVHAILFLLLGMTMRLAMPRWRVSRVALALLLLGIATELVQVLVPGRHSRWSDVLVDVMAGVLGWAVIAGLRR